MTARGWPVLTVAMLICVRHLEGMTDHEYNAIRHASAAALLAQIERGEVDFGDSKARAVQLFKAIGSGQNDVDADGRSARQADMDEMLAAMT